MVKTIGKLFKLSLDIFGYEVRSSHKVESSENPFFILSKLLASFNIKTIIDAGASIGNTSQKFSQMFPEAIVHAIEPYPPFYENLLELASTNKNICAHNFALSDFDGTEYLKVNQCEGTNSLLHTNKISGQIFEDQLKTKKELLVKTQKIDSFFQSQELKNIDILKLDLQGYELTAIKGALQTLNRNQIGAILCEVIFEDLYQKQNSPTQLLEYLIENHSFKLFNFYQHHHHHGRLVQADAILIHSSIIEKIQSNLPMNFFPHSKMLI